MEIFNSEGAQQEHLALFCTTEAIDHLSPPAPPSPIYLKFAWNVATWVDGVQNLRVVS